MDPGHLEFETTAAVEEIRGIVGQPRASAAVEFGFGMARDGYHVFVHGPSGTGKKSLVQQVLARIAAERRTPPDLCYVHNFHDFRRPRLLALPAGTAVRLRGDLEHATAELRSVITGAFESEQYHARRRAIDAELQQRPEQGMAEIGERAKRDGVLLIRAPGGVTLAVLRDGKPLPDDEFVKLPEEERARIRDLVKKYEREIEELMRYMPQWIRERRERMLSLDREVAGQSVGQLMDELRKRYVAHDAVICYLDEMQRHIIDHARELIDAETTAERLLPDSFFGEDTDQSLRRYQVNVLVDHSSTSGAPVLYEDNPTYDRLVGRVEHVARFGTLVTEFDLIKPGALHRANGGFLLLDAHKLLREPYAWDALKRALLAGQIRMESLGQALSLVSTVSLDPEPAELRTQVVLFGESRLYYLLCELDPDFIELFKVAADFDDEIDATEDNIRQYVSLIATLGRVHDLKPFDRSAVARVIEHSFRLAGDQQKLSARIKAMETVLEEADYWATRTGNTVVTASDVQRATDEQIRRSDRVRDRLQDEIRRGTLLIETDGECVGQLNALPVVSLGTFAFGRPSRVTARVRLGKGDVVDIEREVELGGPIHSKGVMILAGYLGARYTPERPLSLSASLVFEQSYGGIEGDSASLAELCALLSAVSDIPLRQSIAVTGSVNQYGEVQAVGGINEKIEGFFDVCRARGLHGRHGVIIPAANRQNLMLRDDVIHAVEQGRFAVYAVQDADAAMELLTGQTAGTADATGTFPADSLNRKIADRLTRFSEVARALNQPILGDGQAPDRAVRTSEPARVISPS